MTDAPQIRREQILNWLHEQQRLTIDDLAARLGVSAMTVHRDLDYLTERGLAQKVHGGVVLVETKLKFSDTTLCHLCGGPLSPRTQFIIQLQTGESISACCPHCGFLMLDQVDTAASVLVRDFLYGRVVHAGQGVYLIDSTVTVCCMPGVLCFASADDARRFQQGFQGGLATFEETRQYIGEHHRNLIR